jgi:pyruvate/2-oxoglutarate dehydrogenase complex dihydrolipoamide dehydrogenase (E3) component
VENGSRVHLKNGTVLEAERILVALGRKRDYSGLNLQAAGVASSELGIAVDSALRTSAPHIYAVGDCNGHYEFSHAAMHQGMLALMNSMIPWPFRLNFRRYAAPATIFTEPQISQVGLGQAELERRGLKHEAVKVNYADYGAAIAEGVAAGFVKVFASPRGRIYGAVVAGEGSGEMINEWALAVQKGLSLDSILMLQHSFPTMSFLNKRIAETWMMNRMRANAWMRGAARLMFRWF